MKKKGTDEGSENEEMDSEKKRGLSKPGSPVEKTKSQRVWDISGKKPSEAVYLVEERKRITRPREKFCYTMFLIEFVFLFLWPAITLFIISWNVAILFVIVAAISATRHYINVAVLIEETGNMELVGGKSYYYPPQSDDMRYATCSLTNIRGGFGEGTLMFDYIAMATLAYTSEDLTQEGLDEWFGEGVAVDRTDIVDEFRAVYDTSNAAVFFKLFEFPSIGLGVISIRGTSNNWDMLADSQLWSAAALMQGIRFVLPAGEIWTPILDQLVSWINRLQGQALEKVSFYILTTEFANYMKNRTDFIDIQVTGHSLGGGLAMVTGAQAKIPAVGVSGPNALISGRSFEPPVSAEDMNHYTFNIVPNRDIVPMLDDKADQFQAIRCESEAWDFVG
ncbi:MAG: hypothetical protein SGILL_001047, partial [Bacillariaceae sp.]